MDFGFYVLNQVDQHPDTQPNCSSHILNQLHKLGWDVMFGELENILRSAVPKYTGKRFNFQHIHGGHWSERANKMWHSPLLWRSWLKCKSINLYCCTYKNCCGLYLLWVGLYHTVVCFADWRLKYANWQRKSRRWLYHKYISNNFGTKGFCLQNKQNFVKAFLICFCLKWFFFGGGGKGPFWLLCRFLKII